MREQLPVLTLRSSTFSPALFLAPMAGFTHSAFRRLVSDFGGTGALWTEMISARMIPREDITRSPCLRRRPAEGPVIYQLMLDGSEPVADIITRLASLGPAGLDINLACHVALIRNTGAGSRLFDEPDKLARTLDAVRRSWPGLLTAKIRLGHEKAGWEDIFASRLRTIENAGIDAIILHPRFFEERLRRRARHELYQWTASLTRLPLIASGDITGPETIAHNREHFRHVGGFMVGRMALVRPWVFAAWRGKVEIDHAEIWRRMTGYICEDFPRHKALPYVKAFTGYFARNFRFGHTLQFSVKNARTIEAARHQAEEFLANSPDILPEPCLSLI